MKSLLNSVTIEQIAFFYENCIECQIMLMKNVLLMLKQFSQTNQGNNRKGEPLIVTCQKVNKLNKISCDLNFCH